MLYSCAHMTTVGVKGLSVLTTQRRRSTVFRRHLVCLLTAARSRWRRWLANVRSKQWTAELQSRHFASQIRLQTFVLGVSINHYASYSILTLFWRLLLLFLLFISQTSDINSWTNIHQVDYRLSATLNYHSHRAFSVAGPMIWNWLPTEFRDLSVGFDVFGALLRRYYSRDISASSAIEMYQWYCAI